MCQSPPQHAALQNPARLSALTSLTTHSAGLYLTTGKRRREKTTPAWMYIFTSLQASAPCRACVCLWVHALSGVRIQADACVRISALACLSLCGLHIPACIFGEVSGSVRHVPAWKGRVAQLTRETGHIGARRLPYPGASSSSSSCLKARWYLSASGRGLTIL